MCLIVFPVQVAAQRLPAGLHSTEHGEPTVEADTGKRFSHSCHSRERGTQTSKQQESRLWKNDSLTKSHTCKLYLHTYVHIHTYMHNMHTHT